MTQTELTDETFDLLLARLREALPDVATQVEDEAGRGRPIPVKSLTQPERLAREAPSWDPSKRSGRILGGDLTVSEYTTEEKVTILLDALRRLGSSMASSREATAELLSRNEVPGLVQFSPEETPPGAGESHAVVSTAPIARARFNEVEASLERALREVR